MAVQTIHQGLHIMPEPMAADWVTSGYLKMDYV
jgi:hypothetical protein